MKKTKLDLSHINVKSFVTGEGQDNAHTLKAKGGAISQPRPCFVCSCADTGCTYFLSPCDICY